MIEEKNTTEVSPEDQPISENRERIGGVINPQIDKMVLPIRSLKTEIKVKPGDDHSDSVIYVECESSTLLDGLYISFFVDGRDEPVTFELHKAYKITEVFLEKELGFDPATTSFNYMIHPKRLK